MIYLIIVQIFVVLFSFGPDAIAFDDSCIVSGTYDGTRCGVDLDGTGDAEDCAELLICRRPDGGQCSGSVAEGYDCSYNGQHYASLTTCQNSCGGTKPFMCPPDIGDPVCNGTSPLTQLTYRDMYPNDFDTNVTYTYARTTSAVSRSSYLGLSGSCGGHPADVNDWDSRSFLWTSFGYGPFFVKQGTLYSDALFYSFDNYSCYRADSFDGSVWRPRDYCPGYNCTNYTTPGTYFQRWEKVQSYCTPSIFCQNAYFYACLPTGLTQNIYLYGIVSNSFIFVGTKTYYMGLNSGYFNYNNAYELYYEGYWYGTQITCNAYTDISGYKVCTNYNQRYYGPIGQGTPYPYDRSGTLFTNASCTQNTSHWVGPAYADVSLYIQDSITGENTPQLYKGTICHNPGVNSGAYNNTQTLAGKTITTTCSVKENVNTCDYGTVNRCTTYRQCMSGSCWDFSFGDTCSNITSTVSADSGTYTMNYSVSSSVNYDKPIQYLDIPLSLYGVHQWDSTKCTPCQTAAGGIITNPDDPIVDPDIVPNPNATCTNFYMFSGAGKKCRKWSLSTLFTNCCELDGWFASWCNDKERELKKRRQAGTCHKVGTYCSKKIKFVNICIERKTSYCCFNSKLARIINEQGRSQVGKAWGSSKRPSCKGFTPGEFAGLDFSSIDLSEYIAEIQGKADTNISIQEITKGIQEWMINQNNPSPLENK